MGIPAWIALVGVVGTWFIFGAAIWGERIRASLFKPQLRVMLDDPRGELTSEAITITATGQVQQYTRPARYYHLSGRNSRRWPIAHDVRILLTRLEKPDPSGIPTTVWTGEIPLAWEHAQIHFTSRSVGRPVRADLAVVAQDPQGSERASKPTALTARDCAKQIWVTVVATANEAGSPALRLELAWDGQWDTGEAEMARHVVIRPV